MGIVYGGLSFLDEAEAEPTQFFHVRQSSFSPFFCSRGALWAKIASCIGKEPIGMCFPAALILSLLAEPKALYCFSGGDLPMSPLLNRLRTSFRRLSDNWVVE